MEKSFKELEQRRKIMVNEEIKRIQKDIDDLQKSKIFKK